MNLPRLVMPKAEVAALLRSIADQIEQEADWNVERVEVSDYTNKASINIWLVKDRNP